MRTGKTASQTSEKFAHDIVCRVKQVFCQRFSDANLGIRQKYEFAQVDDTNK